MNRRHLFGSACLLLPAGLLAGCATSANAGTTPAQILADINGLITSLGQVTNALSQSQPGLIPAATVVQVNALLTEASSLAVQLSTTVAANVAAPIVAQIENALGTALRVLSSIPAIPTPYSGIIAAAGVLLPILSAFVAQYLPAPGVGRPATPDAGLVAGARKRLGVPVVAR